MNLWINKYIKFKQFSRVLLENYLLHPLQSPKVMPASQQTRAQLVWACTYSLFQTVTVHTAGHFTGHLQAQESTAMHTVLWGCNLAQLFFELNANFSMPTHSDNPNTPGMWISIQNCMEICPNVVVSFQFWPEWWTDCQANISKPITWLKVYNLRRGSVVVSLYLS